MKVFTTFLISSALFGSALLYSSFASAQDADQKSEETKERVYTPLTKNSYEALLPGKTIKGEYRFLRELTKTYDFSETHYADGTTDYKEGAVRSKGIWYALGTQKICYRYPNDENMGNGTNCFWVYESEGCYYGYGLNQMTLKGPRNYENWVARWIIGGDGSSCAAATG